MICNIIGGLTAPAKESDVEYYYCDMICDSLIAGLDNNIIWCRLKFGTGVPTRTTELCPLNMDTGIH